ncbi:MAG: divergent polysaccharide deacetylase family protein [Candidatus Omnitrophica bacterium]|nr:divergent polysaccharide deacetylase family protein [Candidatus Omnitrophota bacterium]
MAPRKITEGGKWNLLYGLAGMGVLAILFLTALPQERPSKKQPAPPKPVARTVAVQTRAVLQPAVPGQTPAVPAPRPPAPATTPSGFPPGRGRIAIVLDDWGYNLRQMDELTAIRAPVTVAVLPGLPHSADVARRAAAQGHEVILHMPMESVNTQAPREEGRTILAGMPRSEILSLLERSLATVPGARGINNHQGSRITSDAGAMKVILAEAKRRGLYFLDSRTGESVCAEVAQEVSVPFAERAVFLDNEASAPYIRQQLIELARTAAEQGEAVGIGHDRPVTLSTLRGAIEEMEKAGYTLVPVSELAEEP